jgi:hypothetical protein
VAFPRGRRRRTSLRIRHHSAKRRRAWSVTDTPDGAAFRASPRKSLGAVSPRIGHSTAPQSWPTELAVGLEPLSAPGAASAVRPEPRSCLRRGGARLVPPLSRPPRPAHSADKELVECWPGYWKSQDGRGVAAPLEKGGCHLNVTSGVAARGGTHVSNASHGSDVYFAAVF